MGKIYTAFAFLHSDKFAIFLLFPSASSHPTSELSITPRSLPCDGGNREKYKGWNIGELCQIHNQNLMLSCSFWLISAGVKIGAQVKKPYFHLSYFTITFIHELASQHTCSKRKAQKTTSKLGQVGWNQAERLLLNLKLAGSSSLASFSLEKSETALYCHFDIEYRYLGSNVCSQIT